MKYLTIDPEKIAICLARKLMTRRDLCKETGITEPNMSVMMKNRKVRPVTVGRIAQALGVDVTEILADSIHDE